jgi:hypothetical protein
LNGSSVHLIEQIQAAAGRLSASVISAVNLDRKYAINQISMTAQLRSSADGRRRDALLAFGAK